MLDLPELDPDPLFDDVGDYRHIHEVAQALASADMLDKLVIKDFNDVLQLYSQNVTPSKIDFELYRSKLAWLPVDVIENIFEQATQFYRMPMRTYLKKRYKSHFQHVMFTTEMNLLPLIRYILTPLPLTVGSLQPNSL